MDSCVRAYATVQKLLCHGSYCEPILSLQVARASRRLSFAAQSCRPFCCLGLTRRPTLFAQEICLNPRYPMTRSPLWCCTGIIRSSALVQASSSLSCGSLLRLTIEPLRNELVLDCRGVGFVQLEKAMHAEKFHTELCLIDVACIASKEII